MAQRGSVYQLSVGRQGADFSSSGFDLSRRGQRRLLYPAATILAPAVVLALPNSIRNLCQPRARTGAIPRRLKAGISVLGTGYAIARFEALVGPRQ